MPFHGHTIPNLNGYLNSTVWIYIILLYQYFMHLSDVRRILNAIDAFIKHQALKNWEVAVRRI